MNKVNFSYFKGKNQDTVSIKSNFSKMSGGSNFDNVLVY